jgi:hypothetical protein
MTRSRPAVLTVESLAGLERRIERCLGARRAHLHTRMSFFSSDAYLSTIADVFYPGQAYRCEPVAVGSEAFRLLVVNGKDIVSRIPFWDYVEPLTQVADPPRRSLPYLPHAVRGAVSTATWQAHAAESRHQPAPFVDWGSLASWDAFLAHAAARSPFAFKLSERKRKKLARELGAVTLRQADRDEDLIALGMRWKSAQYRRTSLWDVFRVEKNRRMFLEMCRRGMLDVRALEAGGKVVAMHAGMLHEGRYYYWMPAHDPDTSAYSPGTLLLEHLLEVAHENGWQFDFLIGGEPYKLAYATHVRLVGQAGEEPLEKRLYRAMRGIAVDQVQRTPRVYALLQASKRRWKELAGAR